MSDSPLPTLHFPFERGLLDAPEGRVLVLGARQDFRLPEGFSDALVVQGFRPDFIALERNGFDVHPLPEGEDYPAALILLGRHRAENEQMLAQALLRVKAEGLIVAAGTKKDGAASMRKRVEGLLPIDDHASKFHGVVFWLRRPAEVSPTLLDQLKPAEEASGYFTAAGGFSDDGVDQASALLAEHLPGDITGPVADFAAGWGYLSTRLAARHPEIAIDLYEAHHASLEAARLNMERHAPQAQARFFWHDLVQEPVEERYNFIIMNPPFHSGSKAVPDLGINMIEAAAKALTSGGRLYLVANRPLPYEDALKRLFRQSGETTRDNSFKVLWGRK